MRKFPTTAVILAITGVAIVVGWLVFYPIEKARYVQVAQVRRQRSEIHLARTIRYANGPILEETLKLDNVEGKSSASYAIGDRRGYVARFNEPINGYDVTFAFDLLVRDGIWQLHTKCPPGANPSVVYDVHIGQVAGERSGTHTFSFCDPKYLATTAGRSYEIHLDKNKPVPDLLTLQSTSTADARYAKVVNDFGEFGNARFRKTVAAARQKVLGTRPAP